MYKISDEVLDFIQKTTIKENSNTIAKEPRLEKFKIENMTQL